MNKHIFPFIATLAFLCTLTQCVPPTEEKLTDVRVDFTNTGLQKLYDLQDRGHTDSLIPYFHHKDPTYRYLSAMAFASIQDSTAIDSLVMLLYDPVDEVRIAAAYSLGQIGHSKAQQPLVEAFDRHDTTGVSWAFNSAVMEAVGKCGVEKYLNDLVGISTFKPADTLLLEGQAWGIYRYALRNIVTPEGTAKMMEFATNSGYPSSIRFIAANYLSRAKNIVLEQGDSLVGPALAKEDDPRIRMALAIALGKTNTERAANALLYQYNVERDYRVRCNILRALGNFDYTKIKPAALQALKDPSTAVAVTAGEYFVEHGIPEDASAYWQMAKEPGKWEVQMALYAAAMKYLPFSFEESRKYLNWEIKRRFETTANPYEKAAALKALARFGWNYRYIRDVGYVVDNPIVRTGSVEALASIARMRNFNQFFGGGNRMRQELSEIFLEAIQTGDPGMTAAAAEVLRDTTLGFKGFVTNYSVLESALTKQKLPQDLEAYIEVKKTLDYFKGAPAAKPYKPKYNHPIDWKLITGLKENSKAVIKTKAGDITLELFPGIAPGTVANFIELINGKFYNGKTFHRVVPNFVAQGGCPRGDGDGSLNYTIRSELPYLHYERQGYVGMASAGNHTECTQFFITHSPAPHLDGNYTIFARVTDGMDVVHKLEIGDVMEEVVIVEK